jgi:choline kinase
MTIYCIILAAGSEITNNSKVPKCLLVIGNRTILERQIEILKWLHIDENKIIVVIGSEGLCWNERTIDYIKMLAKNVVFNNRNLSTGSNYSLYLALNNLNLDDDVVLVMDGDVVFDKDLLVKLLNHPCENVLVSRMSYIATSYGGKIFTQHDKVIMAGSDIEPMILPFYIYSGIMKISGRIAKSLKEELIRNPQKHVIDAIGKLVNKYTFYNLDVDFIRSEDTSTFLIGGSGAKLRKIVIVRKEVFGEGVTKLSNEIKWLLSLPEDLRKYFPKIVGYKITKSYAYMDTIYYNLPSLRRMLFDGIINADKAMEILLNLLEFMFKNIYSKVYGKGGLEWLYKLHFERISNRWHTTITRAPVFRRVLKAKKIILNGKELINAPILIQSIKARPKLLEELAPRIITMVHGDLHFQNILIKPDDNSKYNFILTDPRGELNGSDPIYDIGKLWHSFHGLYDFMHEDLFDIKLRMSNDVVQAELKIMDMKSLYEYKKICEQFPKLLENFHPLNEMYDNWKMRTLFTEAIHFCTLMPFHLKGDGKEERAIAMYLTGVKILNDLYYNYKLDDYEEHLDWININTLEDYRKAKLFMKSS